ncbi:hypothetical protein Tsubulata_019047, partial [Turnera subulata]
NHPHLHRSLTLTLTGGLDNHSKTLLPPSPSQSISAFLEPEAAHEWVSSRTHRHCEWVSRRHCELVARIWTIWVEFGQIQGFVSILLAPMLKHDPESRRLSSGSSPATPQKPSSTTRMCGLR